MKQKLLLFFTLTILLLTSWFTFFAPARYGTHGDSLLCGQNSEHETFPTTSTYLLFTQSSNQDNVDIGTCPYQNFIVRTYSLDLWVIAAISGLLTYRSMQVKISKR